MMLRWWTKHLDARPFIVFQRLQRFNQTFIVLTALIAALDIGALSFQEFRPPDANGAVDLHDSSLNRAAQGLFCTSAITAVVSALTAAMLLFQFEGFETATRLDLAVAWIPVALMNMASLEFLLGLICWYAANNVWWRVIVMTALVASFLGLWLVLTVYMYLSIRAKGGLGQAERQVTALARREFELSGEGFTNGPNRWLG
ncbi:hypothetical protein NLG97_g7803 [Lecanicillium saksenae]|uniref:Uncharacterized protein n=1 Tax=Lecanicillium saksenae TaxID=468837 RepID=A0ACC1QLA8_9HYPO|nr:hypothetical protein NLG97_g7803 [Lecanicillium saksenae]